MSEREIVQLILGASFLVFAIRRLLVHLHFFQQEEYDNIRFVKYIFKKLLDKRLSLVLSCVLVGMFTLNLISEIGIGDTNITEIFYPLEMIVVSAILLIFAGIESNPLKTAKKPLVLTRRAKTIYITSIVLIICDLLIIKTMSFMAEDADILLLLTIAYVQILPFALIITNIILIPLEKYIYNKIVKSAKCRLAEVNPVVIGITGSYGKTSVKHILDHVLGNIAPTLATPGSINTVMGISRVIREQLKKEHQYFIVEMGAYQTGSIAKLCRLTPPDWGILTSIGNAHYERFKSRNNVIKAKFELASGVALKNKGKAIGKFIANMDDIDVKKAKINAETLKNMVRITSKSNGKTAKNKGNKDSKDNHDDKNSDNISYTIIGSRQTVKGTEVVVKYKGKEYQLLAPLYGDHQANNIALVFSLAMELGMPAKTIIASLKTTPQVTHRLEVIAGKNSATIIDDAYNSNPIGFKSALGILKQIGVKKRKIVVTPGLVELGKLHNKVHTEIGEEIAKVADILIVVVPSRVPTLLKGFRNNNGKKLVTFKTFGEAKEWLDSNINADDVVLYENDLPDYYEHVVYL